MDNTTQLQFPDSSYTVAITRMYHCDLFDWYDGDFDPTIETDLAILSFTLGSLMHVYGNAARNSYVATGSVTDSYKRFSPKVSKVMQHHLANFCNGQRGTRIGGWKVRCSHRSNKSNCPPTYTLSIKNSKTQKFKNSIY